MVRSNASWEIVTWAPPPPLWTDRQIRVKHDLWQAVIKIHSIKLVNAKNDAKVKIRRLGFGGHLLKSHI